MDQQYSFFGTADIWQGTHIDFGQKALKLIFEGMMIDDAWGIKEDRAFQWWGHNLAQRVWAEPPRDELGELINLVHVETDFLRNVQDTERTYVELNKLQSISSLYAFIYLPSEKKIRLHSTAYVYEGNFGWLSRILLAAAGLQLSGAYGSRGLEQVFEGSEWDSTPHPANGYRETPDKLIGEIGELYESVGRSPAKVPGTEFKEVCKMLAQYGVLATSGKSGLTAEFHFVGDESAVERRMAGKKGVATSLFTTGTDKKHVQLGNGIYSRLCLPILDTQEMGFRRCSRMNLFESTQWAHCHMLGAWQALPAKHGNLDIVFSSFLPALSYRTGLIANLTLSTLVRSKWASTTLNVAASQ
jgi:hypothetical protein